MTSRVGYFKCVKRLKAKKLKKNNVQRLTRFAKKGPFKQYVTLFCALLTPHPPSCDKCLSKPNFVLKHDLIHPKTLKA